MEFGLYFTEFGSFRGALRKSIRVRCCKKSSRSPSRLRMSFLFLQSLSFCLSLEAVEIPSNHYFQNVTYHETMYTAL